MGHGFPLLGIEHAALLFQARHDALDGRGEVLQFHGGRTASPRRQRRLVDPIGEVRAGKARGQCGYLFEVYILGQRHLLDMNLQDVQPPLLVGPVHQHLAVEAAGTQQRLVEDFGAVGGGEDDQPDRAVEAVHLREQLVEGLLALVVAADAARAARTHADEHLDKL